MKQKAVHHHAWFTRSVASEDGKLVLHLAGELEMVSCCFLKGVGRLKEADLIVDLGEVTFMGVREARTLLGARARLASQGRHLIPRNASGEPARVLALVEGARVPIAFPSEA
jgi:anti-anti-sigma regulatory factor